MTVAEAMERISLPEFYDWLTFFDIRAGRPDPDDEAEAKARTLAAKLDRLRFREKRNQ